MNNLFQWDWIFLLVQNWNEIKCKKKFSLCTVRLTFVSLTSLINFSNFKFICQKILFCSLNWEVTLIWNKNNMMRLEFHYYVRDFFPLFFSQFFSLSFFPSFLLLVMCYVLPKDTLNSEQVSWVFWLFALRMMVTRIE